MSDRGAVTGPRGVDAHRVCERCPLHRLPQSQALLPRGYFVARSGDRYHVIPVAEVAALIAEHKYITIVHRSGETVIVGTLLDLEARVPFLRVSRNTLVNPSYIERVQSVRPTERSEPRRYVHLRGARGPVKVSRKQGPFVRAALRHGALNACV